MSEELRLTLVRDVTPDECDWLDRTWHAGDVVRRFMGATYGCITYSGVACCVDDDGPFFELPTSALKVTYEPTSLPPLPLAPGGEDSDETQPCEVPSETRWWG